MGWKFDFSFLIKVLYNEANERLKSSLRRDVKKQLGVRTWCILVQSDSNPVYRRLDVFLSSFRSNYVPFLIIFINVAMTQWHFTSKLSKARLTKISTFTKTHSRFLFNLTCFMTSIVRKDSFSGLVRLILA